MSVEMPVIFNSLFIHSFIWMKTAQQEAEQFNTTDIL